MPSSSFHALQSSSLLGGGDTFSDSPVKLQNLNRLEQAFHAVWKGCDADLLESAERVTACLDSDLSIALPVSRREGLVGGSVNPSMIPKLTPDRIL